MRLPSSIIAAVLSGVLDSEDDTKLQHWLKTILNAMKNHINEPAVQVTYYIAPPPCSVSSTYSGCSLPLPSADISIKARYCQVDRQ